jgi:hypothetical protein
MTERQVAAMLAATALRASNPQDAETNCLDQGGDEIPKWLSIALAKTKGLAHGNLTVVFVDGVAKRIEVLSKEQIA